MVSNDPSSESNSEEQQPATAKYREAHSQFFIQHIRTLFEQQVKVFHIQILKRNNLIKFVYLVLMSCYHFFPNITVLNFD